MSKWHVVVEGHRAFAKNSAGAWRPLAPGIGASAFHCIFSVKTALKAVGEDEHMHVDARPLMAGVASCMLPTAGHATGSTFQPVSQAAARISYSDVQRNLRNRTCSWHKARLGNPARCRVSKYAPPTPPKKAQLHEQPAHSWACVAPAIR